MFQQPRFKNILHSVGNPQSGLHEISGKLVSSSIQLKQNRRLVGQISHWWEEKEWGGLFWIFLPWIYLKEVWVLFIDSADGQHKIYTSFSLVHWYRHVVNDPRSTRLLGFLLDAHKSHIPSKATRYWDHDFIYNPIRLAFELSFPYFRSPSPK